ncbi:MAG: NAD(P)/FAD-dependent oxidoreductase [Streptococcaceae bacterium]|jgi:thioredoxin reductase (NADPH)|nr:NAD(P)/FAD-dependent oxidoreductase [Streptococcaceae bacterium]
MKYSDLIIVGAGPVGLYAAYYAGMRGLTVKIIENFDEAGGQPLNLYPEKHIFDVAALPETDGVKLTKGLLEQLSNIDYELITGQQVLKIIKNQELFDLQTEKDVYKAKAVLLATGNGLLKPRKLGVEGEAEAVEKGRLAYFIKNLDDYAGKSVAVLGGGDSALDWALELESLASEVHLIHRRLQFRAHESTVEAVEKSSIVIHTPYTASGLTDNGLLISKVKENQTEELQVDKILVFYGFLTESTEIVPGLELTPRMQVLSGPAMRTNIPGLYAAGDVCDYEGKLPLISVGFGEAAVAVNDMTRQVNFEHDLRKGHSSSIFGK